MARCQLHELVTLTKQKWIYADNQSVGSLLDNGCKGSVDLPLGAGVQNINL